jgi:hypothetical protein
MLDRASRIGKPDYGAITVAMQQWGLSSTEELVKAYGRALSLE